MSENLAMENSDRAVLLHNGPPTRPSELLKNAGSDESASITGGINHIATDGDRPLVLGAGTTTAFADYGYTERVVDLVYRSFPLIALPLARYLTSDVVRTCLEAFTLQERRAVADLFSTAQAMYLDFMNDHKDDKADCGSEWWEAIKLTNQSSDQAAGPHDSDEGEGENDDHPTDSDGEEESVTPKPQDDERRGVIGNFLKAVWPEKPTTTPVKQKQQKKTVSIKQPLSPRLRQPPVAAPTKEMLVAGLWKVMIDDYLREGLLRISMLFKPGRFGRQMLSDASFGSGLESRASLDSSDSDIERQSSGSSSGGSSSSNSDDDDCGSSFHDLGGDDQLVCGDFFASDDDNTLRLIPPSKATHSVRNLVNYSTEQKFFLSNSVFLLDGYRSDQLQSIDAFLYGVDQVDRPVSEWYHRLWAQKDEYLQTLVSQVACLSPATQYIDRHLESWIQQSKQSVHGPELLRIIPRAPMTSRLEKARTLSPGSQGVGGSLAEANARLALELLAWQYDAEKRVIYGPRVAFDIIRLLLYEFKIHDLQILYRGHVRTLIDMKIRKETDMRQQMPLNSVGSNNKSKLSEQSSELLSREEEYKTLLSNLSHLSMAIVDCSAHAYGIGIEMAGRRCKSTNDAWFMIREELPNLDLTPLGSSKIAAVASQNCWMYKTGLLNDKSNKGIFANGSTDASFLAPQEAIPIRKFGQKQDLQSTTSDTAKADRSPESSSPGKTNELPEFVVAIDVLMQPIMDYLSKTNEAQQPVGQPRSISSLEHLLLTSMLRFYKSELSQLCSLCRPSPESTRLNLRNARLDLVAVQLGPATTPGVVVGLPVDCDQELTYLARQYPYIFYLFIKYMASPYLDIQEILPQPLDSESAAATIRSPGGKDLNDLVSKTFHAELANNQKHIQILQPDECFERSSFQFLPCKQHTTSTSRFSTKWITVGFDQKTIPITKTLSPHEGAWLVK